MNINPFEVIFPSGNKCVVNPPTCGDQIKITEKGWGDYTEAMLNSMGITEDKYKQVKSLFGLTPTCNCPKRKKWLNDVGEWFKNLTKPT